MRTLNMDSDAQFMAVYNALQQFVDNHQDLEPEEMKPDERDQLAAAEAYIDQFSGVLQSIAEQETESRHEVAMERWARRYEDLNGAPESEEDR